MVSLVDGSEFLIESRKAKTHLAGITHFISYEANPLEGIAFSRSPVERGFGLSVPEILCSLLAILTLSQWLEGMVWQSMLLKRTSICLNQLLTLIIVGVSKKNVISIANEEPFRIRKISDNLVNAIEHYIGDNT